MRLKVKDLGNPYDSCYAWLKKAGYEMVDDVALADIVVFNGGSDIATEIYGQKLVQNRCVSEDGSILLCSGPTPLSARDKQELIIYKRCKALGKFILGVCRGAQLINCLEGGTLWQHVNNHNGTHPILDLKTKQLYQATSVHHQMLRVPKGGEIIAVGSEATFKIDEHEIKRCKNFGANLEEGDDPEVVWFKNARALCVQGHPEYHPGSFYSDYCLDLIDGLYHDGVWPPSASTRYVAV